MPVGRHKRVPLPPLQRGAAECRVFACVSSMSPTCRWSSISKVPSTRLAAAAAAVFWWRPADRAAQGDDAAIGCDGELLGVLLSWGSPGQLGLDVHLKLGIRLHRGLLVWSAMIPSTTRRGWLG
jgi:hypothetical protein